MYDFTLRPGATIEVDRATLSLLPDGDWKCDHYETQGDVEIHLEPWHEQDVVVAQLDTVRFPGDGEGGEIEAPAIFCISWNEAAEVIAVCPPIGVRGWSVEASEKGEDSAKRWDFDSSDMAEALKRYQKLVDEGWQGCDVPVRFIERREGGAEAELRAYEPKQ